MTSKGMTIDELQRLRAYLRRYIEEICPGKTDKQYTLFCRDMLRNINRIYKGKPVDWSGSLYNPYRYLDEPSKGVKR